MKTKNNLVKRALSILLTLLIVLGLVPMSVFSTSAAIWDCTHAEYANGFCTLCDVFEPATLNEDGVYEIGNAGQLYWFADKVNNDNANFGSANAVLTADIVVNENVYNEDGTINTNAREWTPIGDSSYGYSGIFDGQSHSVSGLYILGVSIDYVGLFGYVDNATVKNTGVIDSLIRGYDYVGGVCGQAFASKVINCYNSGVVSGAGYIGGVVGAIDDSTITNCYNTGTVSGYSEVGGVSGNAYASKVIDCYNTGTVSGFNEVGGVVGKTDGGGTITNCYNTGEVKGNDKVVGGVVGETSGGGTITNCYNTGEVKGSSTDVGGVVGWNYGGATVTNCYNTGAVSGNKYVGGVVGSNPVGTITNCYNTGDVSRTTNCGGVVGVDEYGTVTNCYYSDTAYAGGIDGQDKEGSAEAKTIDEFKSGEVAYLLQGEQTEEIWGQKIGTDEIPVLGGDKVYFGYTDCKATEKTYANTQVYDEKPSHSWDNGVCTICNNACEHQWEDGVCTVCKKDCEHEDCTNGFCADCGVFEPATLNEDGVYEISNAGQLYWFADKVNNDNANFGSANAVLTADIVVNEGVMDENSTGVRAWTPIGSDSNPYTGTFDGNGKTVSGLYFNNSEVKYVGLFGYVDTNGTVENIGVINSYFNGYYFVGGVAGYCYDSTIANCYNTGTVSGGVYVGGVVGYNFGSKTITNCCNTGTVSGNWYIGGVVGYNYGCTINDCYNTGTVSGILDVGGVVGDNYKGTITNCYNIGTVSGKDYVGGVVGDIDDSTITNCYNTGTVSGEERVGGVVGNNYDNTITNCYYSDTAAGGGINGEDITGSAEAKTLDEFKSGEVAYLLGEAFGQTIGEDDYPVLGGDKVYQIKNCKNKILSYSNTNTSNVHVNYVNGFCDECGEYEPATDKNNDGVYEIANAGQLYWFAKTINKDRITINGELTADIVVNENVLDADGNLNSGSFMEWDAIGNYFNGPTLVGFSGNFDGNGKTISGIYTDSAAGGLFRENYGTIKNINIVDSYFGGASFCSNSNYGSIINCSSSATIGNASNSHGGICQTNEGLVEFCTFTGKIAASSEMWYVGGICGRNGSVIKNCYSSADINGTSDVGGISGRNTGTVENCFCTGKVTIPSTLYGRVCYGIAPGTVVNSYYINTSMNSGGGVAVSQAQFESGEVAYKLGEAWGQKIGTEASPVLGSDKVYFGYTDCSDAEKVYSNTELLVEKPAHVFANGFCADCGVFEPATLNEDGVYEIGNAGQLYWFADKVNNDNANFGSANAVLTADIVVNEGVMDENSTGVRAWTPIGSDSNPYTGTVDGNGKTVSGLYFNKGGVNFVGLFGGVGTNGTVKNIGVINSYFRGYYYVGGVVGYSYDSTIANCYNTSTVIGNECVGGVVGYSYSITITNCYNTGTVSGEWFVGGVVGQNLAGTTNDCYNTGTVSGNDYVGGVAGYSNESTIANCYNTGTVIGNGFVGGVAGYNFGSKTITNCYNTGTVSSEDYVGGVVGLTDGGGTITNCYNTGTVSGGNKVGGVVGYNYDTTITNCYYSDATCEGGINGGDAEGSAEAKTTEQFESGEVAYLLGEAFGQKIGEDDTPVLGGDKVYFGYDTCDEDVDQVYSNEALSNERLPHVWYDGFCTGCDKVCVHTGGTATCTKYAVCEICGTEYGDPDVNNHVGESTPEFNWFAPSYGSCYVEINLICDDCESSVAYDYGYASVAESAEGTDCLHPGYELYEITFEIDGTSYTDSYKHILKSDNHVGEFENGFCSVCGGFEPAYFNEEEWVYEISNAGQLYWYAQKLNEENAEMSVVLTEDIVIPEDAPNWEPITASYVTFDGQFHTISGINSVHENYTYVGMFGNEVWWYEIKNLHLTDSNFEGSDYVGGLVASMNNGGTVQNCYVTNTTVKGGDNTGALVGFLGMSNVLNCYVDTDTLVGDFNGYGSIENSYYLAEVETEDGGKTLEQFKSGEVAYLLQAGIAGEDIYDDEWNYIETIIPEIWGQTIGKEDYPVLGGEKVYLSDGNYYNKANKLAGYTIGLGDKIAVNYYMSLTEETLADENAKMVFTVPDTGSTYTVEIPVSEAVKSGNYYVFTCEVAAKEMTSVIEAKLVTSEGELQLEDYTVQQYAEVILSDKTKYAKEQELVKAMLNYGAYAQIYFGYNTESLANSILVEADRVLSDADLSNYEFALTDNDEIVSYYGSALSLETETAIKCYFIIDGDAEAVTATVNGEEAVLKKNGNLYELKISDISAHQLNRMYEIKVGDLTLTYGAFSYGYTAMSSTKDALKNVVKAMYEYNQMAVDYKG